MELQNTRALPSFGLTRESPRRGARVKRERYAHSGPHFGLSSAKRWKSVESTRSPSISAVPAARWRCRACCRWRCSTRTSKSKPRIAGPFIPPTRPYTRCSSDLARSARAAEASASSYRGRSPFVARAAGTTDGRPLTTLVGLEPRPLGRAQRGPPPHEARFAHSLEMVCKSSC